MVSIMFYNSVEFIILLQSFLVISFAQYKQYIICPILVNKISDVLHAFTCVSAIVNLLGIYSGVNILSPFSCFASYLGLDTIAF